MLSTILTGLALLLLGEGLFLALWPARFGPSVIQQLFSIIPDELRRWLGLAEAACGVGVLYWVFG
ncbi:MAG: hypothetical protein ACI9KS_001750 [Sulfitobacter sp.]|jgi:uncharacterized protein YjeT (DUF2065 family)